MKRLIVLLAVSFMAASVNAAEPSTWPQWRGPTRDGQVKGPEWPDTLKGAALQQKWRLPLGPGYSGPIVAEDRVFVTETVNKKDEVVRALDRATGRELWRQQWPGAMSVPFFAKANGDWIRATPAYDGENLYVAGMRDVLLCLDAKSGAVKWRFDFVKEFGSELPAFGFVCSPLVTGDAVYVQAGASFVRLNRNSGKLVWRTLNDGGGMFGSAFSSPVFAEVGGRPQLLVQTRTKLCGVNPDDGTPLWEQEIPAFRGMNILTPTLFEGGLFTSAYGGKTHFFTVGDTGGKPGVRETWNGKWQGNMSTPVVVNGHAYLHLRNQRVMCIDLRTGKETWTSTKLYGKYWSLVANGDKILALDEKGILYLLRANPAKFDQIDERKLDHSETWAHLAVCGREVYVRDLNGLTVFDWNTR